MISMTNFSLMHQYHESMRMLKGVLGVFIGVSGVLFSNSIKSALEGIELFAGPSIIFLCHVLVS